MRFICEKLTVQTDEGLDDCAPDSKGKLRCEEALNPLGEKRAELLADWFEDRGIIKQVTHVISSDKQRTRQTVQPTAQKVIDSGGDFFEFDDTEDGIRDGIVKGFVTRSPACLWPRLDRCKH